VIDRRRDRETQGVRYYYVVAARVACRRRSNGVGPRPGRRVKTVKAQNSGRARHMCAREWERGERMKYESRRLQFAGAGADAQHKQHAEFLRHTCGRPRHGGVTFRTPLAKVRAHSQTASRGLSLRGSPRAVRTPIHPQLHGTVR
jgi:hypothetical protein